MASMKALSYNKNRSKMNTLSDWLLSGLYDIPSKICTDGQGDESRSSYIHL